MPRLLVTGASGFLGWNLCRIAAAEHDVVGLAHGHPVEVAGVRAAEADLTDPAAMVACVREHAPDAVIHTAAMAQPNLCEQAVEASRAINVETTHLLARICSSHRLPFVFTSTDLVFDGGHAPYAEDDTPAPVSTYGRHKAEAEELVLDAWPEATVARLPLLYGDAPGHARSSIHSFLAAIAAGRPLKLFTDEYRTPASAADAAHGLLLALERGIHGPLHLGGRQRLSRYELGVLLLEATGSTARLEPISQIDLVMAAPRPADVSLDSSRAFALGYDPGLAADELARLDCVVRTGAALR